MNDTVRPYPQIATNGSDILVVYRQAGESLNRGVAGKINRNSGVEAWSHIEGLFFSNLSFDDCGSVDCCSDGTRFYAVSAAPARPATGCSPSGRIRRTPPWSWATPAPITTPTSRSPRPPRTTSTTAPTGCSPPTPSITTTASSTPTTTIARRVPRAGRIGPVVPGTRTPPGLGPSRGRRSRRAPTISGWSSQTRPNTSRRT